MNDPLAGPWTIYVSRNSGHVYTPNEAGHPDIIEVEVVPAREGDPDLTAIYTAVATERDRYRSEAQALREAVRSFMGEHTYDAAARARLFAALSSTGVAA